MGRSEASRSFQGSTAETFKAPLSPQLVEALGSVGEGKLKLEHWRKAQSILIYWFAR